MPTLGSSNVYYSSADATTPQGAVHVTNADETFASATAGTSGKANFTAAIFSGSDDTTTGGSTGSWEITYSDSISGSPYNSSNGVFTATITMGTGAAGAITASSADANISGLTYSTAAGLSGTISGLIDGRGYGFLFAHSTNANASVGLATGQTEVLVNGGPTAISNNYRVNFTAISGSTDNAKVTINLAGTEIASHTTGNYADIKEAKLTIRNHAGGPFYTRTLTIGDSVGTNALVTDVTVDYGSAVAGNTFEYSLKLVDNAGATTPSASTTFNSSASNIANNTTYMSIDSSQVNGTSMVVTYHASSFTGMPIVGYKVYYQVGDASSSTNHFDIALANLGATTVITSTDNGLTATLTGLTKLGKYCVWVRAYHADGAVGSMGADEMGPPSPVGTAAELLTNPNFNDWAGKFTEGSIYDAASAGNYVAVTGDNYKSLTGAPAAPVVSLHNGLAMQPNDSTGVSTATEFNMNNGLSIKWEDKDLDFGGSTTSGAMEYVAVDTSDISVAAFTSLLADSLVDAPNTSTTGTSNGTFHEAVWTAVSIGNLGIGTFTPATAGAFVNGAWVGPQAGTNTSTRYCMFEDSVSAGGISGSTLTNSIHKTKLSKGFYTTDPDTGVVTYDQAGTSFTVQSAAALDLGKTYAFAFRLKNDVGDGAYTITTAKMVQGKADASALTGIDAAATLWNATLQRFETTVTAPTAATGGMSAVTYTAKVVATAADDVKDVASNTKYTIDAAEHYKNAVTAVYDADAGTTLLHFNAVSASTTPYTYVPATESATESWTAGTINDSESTLFSAMQGMKFAISYRATNANGYAASGEKAVTPSNARQAFATKDTYAALTPDVTIVSPILSGTVADGDAVYGADVRLNTGASHYTVSVDIKDLLATAHGGRRVDEVKYKLYQTRSNGAETIIVETVSAWASSAASIAAAGANTDQDVADMFNIRFAKPTANSPFQYGYALKLKVELVSEGAADLTQTGLTGDNFQDFKTGVTERIFNTIPLDTTNESGHMAVAVADGSLTVHWSQSNQLYTANGETMLGYRLELYDYAMWTNTTGGLTNFVANAATTGSMRAHHHTSEISPLGVSARSHTFTGLENGRIYVPILYTTTLQGEEIVQSDGRSVTQSDVGVATTIDVTEGVDGPIVRTNKVFGGAVTNVFGVTGNQGIPFGLPEITAHVANGTLEIDDNGSPLLFGAMLQTQSVHGGAAVTAAGRIGGAAAAASDVFYLDLSFGSAGSATATQLAPVLYSTGTAGVGAGVIEYAGRSVTMVGPGYLGTNWADETNYIFASNAAGTSTGKVTGGVQTIA
jgi:hypothetical protein